MESTWKKQNYSVLQTDTKRTIYGLVRLGDDKEYVLESQNKFQEKIEINHRIGTISLPEPVYVIRKGGKEEIRYNSTIMKLNKIYEVEWNGKQYGLRKTSTEVEILRFYPDAL